MKAYPNLRKRALPVALATLLPLGAAASGESLLEGAVYTQTNSFLAPNIVIGYERASSGQLTEVVRMETGGMGDNLGQIPSGQNAVLLSVNPNDSSDQVLFVVNAGSGMSDGTQDGDEPRNGTISVFRVEADGLVLTDVESTRGVGPRAVTVHEDLVYVVNGGTDEFEFQDGPGPADPIAAGIPRVADPVFANIAGFDFDRASGNLTLIDGSVKDLADGFGTPAQISFDNNGEWLVVSQRNNNFALITGLEPDIQEVFPVNEDGTTGDVVLSEVTGNDTFGFLIDRNNRVVFTHGNGQIPNGGSMSVAEINEDGTLSTIFPALPDGASDTCWNVITYRTDPATIYTNAAFDSGISIVELEDDGRLVGGSFAIGPNGPEVRLPRLNTAAPRGPGESELPRFGADLGGFDVALSTEDQPAQYLYAIHNPVQIPVSTPPNPTSGTIAVFRVELADDGIPNGDNNNGDLVRLEEFRITGLPSTFYGLAAY